MQGAAAMQRLAGSTRSLHRQQQAMLGAARRLAAPRQSSAGSGWQRARVQTQAKRGMSELLKLTKRGGSDRDPLKPGNVSPALEVPSHIPRPPYADTGRLPDWDTRPQVQDAVGVEKMRAAGKLAAQVLQRAGSLVKPGVTTDAIDKAVHQMIIEAGAYPSPLNYGGFPKSVCTSVNECICHGIPDSRPLSAGDIVNIDVTVYLNGYHGDTSAMFFAGEPTPGAKRLVEVTKQALDAAIAQCGPGVPFKVIGNTIQRVADSHRLGVVRAFVGHGVGSVFHAWPHVFHFKNNEPGVMQPGQTFTIEPMLSEGSTRERYWADGWTAVTTDGSLSAQYEHTLLITDKGVEILTLP